MLEKGKASKTIYPDGKTGFFVQLDQEQHREFKAYCAKKGMSMTEALNTMINAFISSQK